MSDNQHQDYKACARQAADVFAKAEAAGDPAIKAELLQLAKLWKETAEVMRRKLLGRGPLN